jgi:hypothetical protein
MLKLTLISFATLLLCSCAHKSQTSIDTAPVSQGLTNIDSDFQKIQKENDRKLIRQIAQSGRVEVASTQQKLSFVQFQADKLAGERDWWKSDSETKDAKIIEKEKAISKYQKKLNLLGILLASVAAWLAFVLLGLLIPYVNPQTAVYFLAGRAVVAGFVFLVIFTWVRYL